MRALGIDPGYDRLGVAILELVNGKETVIYSDCIETESTHPLPERLHQLGVAIDILLTTYQPTIVGIETLFFNKNVKTAIGVAQARGIIVYLAKQHHCNLFELGPQEIKIAITGYGKSDKQAVVDMTKRLVSNVPDQAMDDEYDAIAAAVTALAHHR